MREMSTLTESHISAHVSELVLVDLTARTVRSRAESSVKGQRDTAGNSSISSSRTHHTQLAFTFELGWAGLGMLPVPAGGEVSLLLACCFRTNSPVLSFRFVPTTAANCSTRPLTLNAQLLSLHPPHIPIPLLSTHQVTVAFNLRSAVPLLPAPLTNV